MATLGIAPAAKNLALQLVQAVVEAELSRKKDFIRVTDRISVTVRPHLERVAPVARAINANKAVGLPSPSEKCPICVLVHVCDNSAASFDNGFAL